MSKVVVDIQNMKKAGDIEGLAALAYRLDDDSARKERSLKKIEALLGDRKVSPQEAAVDFVVSCEPTQEDGRGWRTVLLPDIGRLMDEAAGRD